MSIEAPFTLASLPKPFDKAAGKTFCSPVSGFRGQKRRKRAEIAVGVDGEGISLYNVHNPRLITSYALPPQTRFLCPPCSVYRKLTGRATAQRLTYAVVSTDALKKSELISFAEELPKDAEALSAARQAKSSYTLTHTASDASTLLALPLDAGTEVSGSALDVCVVYNDGFVECVSGDLEREIWTSNTSKSELELEHTTLIELDVARKGLLKGREDAVALLEEAAHGSTSKTRSLLVTITRSVGGTVASRHLTVFAVHPRSKDLISSVQQGLQEVLSYDLPSDNSHGEGQAEYILQAANGKLHQLLSGTITTFDLSGTLPQTVSRLRSSHDNFQSFARVSPSTLIASGTSSCGIYDTTFTSIQASIFFPSDLSQQAGGDNRKRSHDQAPEAHLHFISYFSDMGMAVALSKDALVGVQIRVVADGRKRARFGTSLLIDSLGKGAGRPRRSKPEEEQAWIDWKLRIDDFVDKSDVVGLEKYLAADLGLVRVKKANLSRNQQRKLQLQAKREAQDHLVTNGTNGTNGVNHGSDDEIDGVPEESGLDWRFPQDLASLIDRTDQRKALYCLGKIFDSVDEQQQDPAEPLSVVIILFAPNVFKWLALTGYMSSDMVQRSLREEAGGEVQIRVKRGDLIKAVNDFDPGFRLLQELLSLPIHLHLEDVVQALKTVVRSLESLAPASEVMAITQGEEEEGNMVNGELEDAIMRESEAAEHDLDRAEAALNEGLALRSVTLHTVFSRLHAFPVNTITQALRSTLTQDDIVFFIQLLRIELADGGWTTRYIDGELDGHDANGPSDRSIAVISSLLNCAIDAIGTSGWLVGLTSNSEVAPDEMLMTLRAETSAALEGCHEASSLCVFLNDFERYSNVLAGAGKGLVRKKPVDPIRHPGFLASPQVGDATLPLGYKVQTISTMRKSGVGQVKKSKSAIGKEMSMRVGKYSIDRIRV